MGNRVGDKYYDRQLQKKRENQIQKKLKLACQNMLKNDLKSNSLFKYNKYKNQYKEGRKREKLNTTWMNKCLWKFLQIRYFQYYGKLSTQKKASKEQNKMAIIHFVFNINSIYKIDNGLQILLKSLK